MHSPCGFFFFLGTVYTLISYTRLTRLVRPALVVLLVRVEVVAVNAHRVDVPGLSVVWSGHSAITRAVQGDGVLEVEVYVAEVDSHVLPGVGGEGAAGVEVAFVAGVDVGGVDRFVCGC